MDYELEEKLHFFHGIKIPFFELESNSSSRVALKAYDKAIRHLLY